MANFYGKVLKKNELLRRTGNIAQVAYIRPVEYLGGKANGTKVYEVSNGTGLEFSVAQSKGLDIMSLKYKGINMNYMFKGGIIAPELADMHGTEFFRCINGGMIYTCGLHNVGLPCEDNGLTEVFHGVLKTTPSDNVCIMNEWDGDDYVLKLSGEIRQAAIYNENLVIKRTITTKTGSKSIKLQDFVENQGFTEQGMMMLYHVNTGFPLLDEGTRLLIPSKDIKARDDISAGGLDDYATITAPIDAFTEHVFFHKVACDKSGLSAAAVINDNLKIGLYIKYNTKNMPNLVEWKSMVSGDYALGIMPSTGYVSGRTYEKEHGKLKMIAPSETLEFGLEIGILEGSEEIKEFENYIKTLV
jgi:hypothetical protein